MAKLSREERTLRDSVERGEWRTVRGVQSETARYRRYARETFRKDQRVNIRISGKDLGAIKKRALEEGLPYQTLISSLLHKYASGRLLDQKSLTRSSSRSAAHRRQPRRRSRDAAARR